MQRSCHGIYLIRIDEDGPIFGQLVPHMHGVSMGKFIDRQRWMLPVFEVLLPAMIRVRVEVVVGQNLKVRANEFGIALEAAILF